MADDGAPRDKAEIIGVWRQRGREVTRPEKNSSLIAEFMFCFVIILTERVEGVPQSEV